jgi:hypothetical protein
VCVTRARESSACREKVLVLVTTMASLMRLVTLIPSYASSGRGEFGDAAVAAQDFSALLQLGCNNRRSSRSAKELGSSLKWSSSSSFRLPPDLSSVSSVCSGASSQRRLALVCMVLPTGNIERTSSKDHPAWEARAVKSFSMSELEARKLKYPTTGTEALLMGIMTEGTSEAARFLRRNGFTLSGVREEIVKLLGKADMYFFSPEHPPLTESAQKALNWATDEKNIPAGQKELSTSMLVLGIWAQKGSDGQKVLAALGFDDDKASELAASVSSLVQH